MVKSTGHKAFELLPVIENFPKKVTALAVWGNTLYVGLLMKIHYNYKN